MRVKVLHAWSGGHRRAYDLHWRDSHGLAHWQRIGVPCDCDWNRRFAREALDVLEHVYGLKRRNIRFNVV